MLSFQAKEKFEISHERILAANTGTVGAALWAADIEAKETEMTTSTAPDLREEASKVE